MKLRELLEIILAPQLVKDKEEEKNLYIRGEDIIPYKNAILACEEFKDFKGDIVIWDSPIVPYVDPKYKKLTSLQASTYNIEGCYFTGDIVYLYELSLSHELYNPSILHKPVKDDSSITPIQYDVETFERFKDITLRYYPNKVKSYPALCLQLGTRLYAILSNEEEYTPKGVRSVIARGKFTLVKNK